MTSKDRLMLALRKETPDRLPVSVHQWQRFHLDTFLGGMSELEREAAGEHREAGLGRAVV